VILVTVGSNGSAFDRLLSELDGLGRDEELVVQHGPSLLRPKGATCVPFMHFTELERAVASARLVITHAGVGSVLLALMNNKRPLVVPRLARYGEVVDDHQVHFAERLARESLITLVVDPRDLPRAVAEQPPANPSQGTTEIGNALQTELRRYFADAVTKRR
jgi:UDP-N-acetylglucosamine transferase subunit ALG13